MAANTDQLADAGSSSYTSNTMHVGDGTWDNGRDSFLLPNLQGLNFATTRYNGMGNRFKGLPQYHTLITGHAVLAAITFLAIMPAAIFLAKYGHDWPGGRVSFKLHIYLQIMVIFLVTVVLALGVLAVGPERSLSNPHHGIGVAIYVLILFQFIYGSCWFRRERKRNSTPLKLPLTVWLHRILGRTTAVLGVVQIGLGLTLYGSPRVLFILYGLMAAFLLFLYLALDYYYMPRSDGTRPGGGHQSEYNSDYGSYLSGSRVDAAPPRKTKHHHWGEKLLAAGGLYGAYEWWKHRQGKKKEGEEYEEKYDGRVDNRPPPSMGPPPLGPTYGQPPPGAPYGPQPTGPYYGPPPIGPPVAMASGARSSSRPPSRGARPPPQRVESRESWEDEKYSDDSYKPSWGNRILGATGAFAAYEGVRGLFDRRKRKRDDDYNYDYDRDDRRYGAPLGGNRTVVDQTDVSRVEAGEVPTSPNTPRVNMGGVQPMTPTMTPSRPPRRPRPSGDSVSYDSRESYEGGRRPTRPISGGDDTFARSIRAMGPIAGFKDWNRRRKDRREVDRAEEIRRQELYNEEQFNRRNRDSYPRPEDANMRRQSMSGTMLTGPASAQDPGRSEMSGPQNVNVRPDPDTSHPPLPAEAGTFGSTHDFAGSREYVTTEQQQQQQQGYSLPPPPPVLPPVTQRSDGYGPGPEFGSAQMPQGAVSPDPSRLLSDNTAANEASAYGREPTQSDVATAAAAGAAAATAAMAVRQNESLSPTRPSGSRNRLTKMGGRGSTTSASAEGNPNSPPVSVKVKMHNDGRHVTLRRLNEEEAATEREARRQERRNRRRRGSSLSSGIEDEAPPGQRYRRTGGPSGIRPSNDQPITNIPPPPAMSSSAGASFRQNSAQNLPAPAPIPPQGPPPVPQHSVSPPSAQGFSPPNAMNESGFGSPGDAAMSGTDVSAFDNNRRRRRAERARRLEAAAQKSGGAARSVEFQ